MFSLFSKLEFAMHLTIISILQIYIYLHGNSFSRQAQQKLPLPWVQPGLLSMPIDLSDDQWRSFRSALLPLSVAMTGYVTLSQLIQSFRDLKAWRPTYCTLFSLLFLSVLHGWYIFHVLTLAALHYYLIRFFAGKKNGLLIIWAVACALFIAVRKTEGLPFVRILPLLGQLKLSGGLLRWHIHYNLVLLRILSFASDWHWACLKVPNKGSLGHSKRYDENKARISRHLPPDAYNFLAYITYILYPPLYIAGPIITFNSYVSQTSGGGLVQLKQVLMYGLRWCIAWMALELLTHSLYFNSIAKYRVWEHLVHVGVSVTPLHYVEGSFWVLMFMWLKFTVIWRFFRLAALADGVDPPENMTRCLTNNYDIEGFWRNWHASYNQWLVRYMYIPLGGSQWRLLNVWIIFTFVALWHDLEFKLLGWAWIMALGMAPEMMIKSIRSASAFKGVKHSWIWRQLCAIFASLNIVVLMTGNMIGFVVGVDGVMPLLKKLIENPLFLSQVLGTLFSAVQVMFFIRDLEEHGRNNLYQ
ncbi:hypothetical protein CEUSTIGMA_g9857.t1 [Chlamydomonas eustigma]|uniref:Uncharacterized protein n=1 Tax=Chlamydomonas eustigma TaxID=1157962 RepID=A0A250XHN1_9CHLO|nr:hypothetical protein CEUSTIGMA_g9857.t1 [Chlamydomonas eustigma]|eukprot:GAX82429.1 hypothetical protein CEUSTIGMA_g9857.t1 [Chlamydomonas eustigma]